MFCLSPACADHTFGEACKHQCDCVNGTVCDKVTGACHVDSMCAAGYEGQDCKSPTGITNLNNSFC